MNNSKLNNDEITLPMILDLFSNQGKELIWSILDVDFMGDFDDGEYYGDLLLKIYEKEGGKIVNYLTWDELNAISKKFTVLTSFIVIGCKNKLLIDDIKKSWLEPKNHYPTAKDIKNTYDILIYIDDDNLWKVNAKDKSIPKSCEEKFGKFPIRLYLSSEYMS